MPQGPLAAATALSPSNVQVLTRVDAQGAQLSADRHAFNYEAAYAGAIGLAANPTGVTTSAGLATTCVGLILSNPAGNSKNLVLMRVTGAFIVAPSTVTGLGLITGYAAGGIITHTTPLTPFNGKIGTGPALTGLVDSAATLVGTPAWTALLGETPTATTLPFFSIDLAGAIILPPGAYAALGTTIAGPAGGFQGSFMWEEVAV